MMKRFGIATVILLAVLAADVFGGESRRAPRPPVHIQLIASDAPGWMHTGGPPSRYLCPATNAEVQMQAAVDACSAAGGGVIEASEGTFLVSKPAGAVDVTISSAALKADAPVDGVAGPLTLYTLTYGTGAHTNVSVGQIYRVTGGTGDTSGNSIETQEEWLNATVMRKNAANTNVTTATWTDATNTLTEVGAFASYTYAAGDLIFISGGTNATVGWYTIASRVSDDAITTDTDIDDGAGDLAAGDITGPDAVGLSETMLEDYTGVVATRLIAAVVLKPQVSIVGSGQYVTYIKLADQQNCDVIHTEAGATFVYAAMEKLTIDGNKANQGDEVATSFNGECNGIVLNEYGIDLYFRDVSVVSCKG
ncbi:MAG: hypothetical protein ACYTAO_22615, partial [Planctomycetota bacterium]